MVKDEDLNGFFVENEDKFSEAQLSKSINALKKYAKLIGRNGSVHIEDKSLSGTDKLKLFLITRYLGSELTKLRPKLKIDPSIKSISSKDIETFLSVDGPNARSRMSALVKEGFVKRSVKGKIEIEPFQVERFLKELENKDKQVPTKQEKSRKKKKEPEEIVETKIDVNSIYERLIKDLSVDSKKIRDILYIKEDGSFKFHSIEGSSKTGKQRNCILLSAYTDLMGFGHKSFQTSMMTEICFHSMVDNSDINQTIKKMKKKELISKEGHGSHKNILREKGKSEARELFKQLCKSGKEEEK